MPERAATRVGQVGRLGWVADRALQYVVLDGRQFERRTGLNPTRGIGADAIAVRRCRHGNHLTPGFADPNVYTAGITTISPRPSIARLPLSSPYPHPLPPRPTCPRFSESDTGPDTQCRVRDLQPHHHSPPAGRRGRSEHSRRPRSHSTALGCSEQQPNGCVPPDLCGCGPARGR